MEGELCNWSNPNSKAVGDDKRGHVRNWNPTLPPISMFGERRYGVKLTCEVVNTHEPRIVTFSLTVINEPSQQHNNTTSYTKRKIDAMRRRSSVTSSADAVVSATAGEDCE
jgi:hypothetical protein